MLDRQLWNALFVIFFTLSFSLAEYQDFEICCKEGSATAIFAREELLLNVYRGPRNISSVGTKFILTIGGCEIEFVENIDRNDVPYTSEEINGCPGHLIYLQNITSIVARANSIDLRDIGGHEHLDLPCEVKLGNKRDGNYHVPIKLSGDVPGVFKLSSREIKMDKPKETVSSVDSSTQPKVTETGPTNSQITEVGPNQTQVGKADRQEPIVPPKLICSIESIERRKAENETCHANSEATKLAIWVLFGLGGVELFFVLLTVTMFVLCSCTRKHRRKLKNRHGKKGAKGKKLGKKSRKGLKAKT